MYKSLLLAVLAGTVSVSALATGQMTVYKSQYCGCCKTWIKHMEENGFEVKVVETEQLDPIKQQHGITPQLASCHTGLIDGYVVEGHVPARDVIRLLAERPAALGLAVPAMPLGSPGMETPQGHKDPYDTLLVLRSGATQVFARHNPPT